MKNILLILSLLSFSIISAQEELYFEFDYAQFGYDSTANNVEIYYSFSQNDLSVVETDSGFLTSAVLYIQLKDSSSGEVMLDKEWKVNNILQDTSLLNNGKSLIGVVDLIIPEGTYDAKVEGRDFTDKETNKKFYEKIVVRPLLKNTDSLSMSDIELATNVKRENVNENSIFYKNTLEVIPNPTMLYSENIPVLFYYVELYNLAGTSDDNLVLQKLLYNSKGALVQKEQKPVKRNENSIVDIGLLNLKNYPTDSYSYVMNLVDTTKSYGVASSKKFFLYNPGVVDTINTGYSNMGYLGSEFAVKTDEELDLLFDQSKYIATSKEIDQYKNLDSLSAKREFLYNFWQNRDTDPATPQNEFKREYMQRLDVVNARYDALNKPGYKSDRGRIYLTYGEPDQLDRYPNEPNYKPYEIWFYNSIEGGVTFIFGDLTGFSGYELLHSTKRGEVRDENWMRRISTN